MKAKVIRGTTLNGRCIHAGDIVELDSSDFNLLKMQGDVAEHSEGAPKASADGEAKPVEPTKPKGK